MGFSIRRIALFALLVALAGVSFADAAVSIRIDYSKDTNNFFPAGSQARAAMEAAASFYNSNLEDTLSEIETPARFLGSQGGEVTWHWRRSYLNPSGGGTLFETDVESNISMDADELVVFVGGQNLPGSQIGLGGPGGILRTSVVNGKFTSDEDTTWKATDDVFKKSVDKRQETSGFASWGGAISFDNATTWNFNHNAAPGAGQTDFFSTALHELGHVLGLGTTDAWNDLVTETKDGSGNVTSAAFKGSHAKSFFNNAEVPLAITESSEGGHWLQSISTSTPYGGGSPQLPLMVPGIDPGIRRVLTNLDAAALADIGWEIDLPAGAASMRSLTFTGLSDSSAGSATLSANVAAGSVAPEPGGFLLAALAGMLSWGVRRPGRK